MSSAIQQALPSIFAEGYRGAGILLHVTSLPSSHGIGDVGPAARSWVDRLAEADQTWWQLLPLGPTGYGNSPYQLLSSFAGNELLISPNGLIESGLLQAGDCEGNIFSSKTIDYNAVIPYKRRLLLKACAFGLTIMHCFGRLKLIIMVSIISNGPQNWFGVSCSTGRGTTNPK